MWFLWVEASEDVIIYSQDTARRLRWIKRRAEASLHLNDNGHDYLVMTGTLRRVDPAYARPDQHLEFLSKYRSSMHSIFGEPASFMLIMGESGFRASLNPDSAMINACGGCPRFMVDPASFRGCGRAQGFEEAA